MSIWFLQTLAATTPYLHLEGKPNIGPHLTPLSSVAHVVEKATFDHLSSVKFRERPPPPSLGGEDIR